MGEEITKDLLSRAADGINVLVPYAEEAIRESLINEAVISLFNQGIAIAMLVSAYFMYNKIWKKNRNTPEKQSASEIILAAVILLSAIGGFALLANFDWLQILLFPKAYTMQHASCLLHGNCN